MSRWWVIVNPSAGRGRDLTLRAKSALNARSVGYEVRTSESAEAIGGIVQEGRDLGYEAFISVGGDGTANLVLNQLLKNEWAEPPTLGILPAGSGSDFVRTFAIPNELEAAADHLLDEDRYPVDVGRLSGSVWPAVLPQRGECRDRGPHGRRSRAASRTGWARDGTSQASGRRWRELRRTTSASSVTSARLRAVGWNVVIANGQFFGGGMNVAPRAAAGDGLFDVQVYSGPRRHRTCGHPQSR